MPPDEIPSSINPFARAFLQELMRVYWGPLYKYVTDNPALISSMPGFLLNHEKIIVYVGRTHVALEYIGSETTTELKNEGKMEVVLNDYSTKDCNLFEMIIGFKYDSTLNFNMPLPQFSENFLLPTNKGFDKLLELGWNFQAQNSIMGFNMPTQEPMVGQFTRIVNGLFFDANESGLMTRHIKWIDFFPIHFDGSDAEVDTISFNIEGMGNLVEHDANYTYPLPIDYKFIQLPKINRFIEIWGNSENSEPKITKFLSMKENEFILTMRFGALRAHAELECEWQSEEKPATKPDFFVVQPNGYADIVEFKLPDITGEPIVGRKNREGFGSWLNSYVSQTRVYSTYFDDPNNRRWFEDKYGFKVHKPRRWLVVGRRSDFQSEAWREIVADYKDLEIMTFDDLIDGVVAQFYKA